MNTRPCPDCGKTTKAYGPPKVGASGFIDQIIVCSCGWCGVITEWPDEERLAING